MKEGMGMDNKFQILYSVNEVEGGIEISATTNIDGETYTGQKVIQKTINEINLEYEALELICEEIRKKLNK